MKLPKDVCRISSAAAILGSMPSTAAIATVLIMTAFSLLAVR
jgi:hypothetical protein